MIHDDDLERALSALRDAPAPSANDTTVRATRQRILDDVHPPRGRIHMWAAAAVLLACMSVSTVWAAVSTGVLERWLEGSMATSTEDPARDPAPGDGTVGTATPRDATQQEATAHEATPHEAMQEDPALDDASHRASSEHVPSVSAPGAALQRSTTTPMPRATGAASGSAPRSAEAGHTSGRQAARAQAPDDASDREALALYNKAHQLHFGATLAEQALAEEALAAWEQYLAHCERSRESQGPAARFVPEARYNSAILLLRLDRTREAARLLRPFAQGQYDGYRQSEALRLIDAM